MTTETRIEAIVSAGGPYNSLRELALGQVRSSRGRTGVCRRKLLRVPVDDPGGFRHPRRAGREMAGRHARLDDERDSRGGLSLDFLSRPRAAARALGLAVGRVPEEALRAGAAFSVLVDGRSEGGAVGRARGQQDRRPLAAVDVHPVRGAARPTESRTTSSLESDLP